MTSRVQMTRFSVSGDRPVQDLVNLGSFYINFADLQLGVIDGDGDPVDLVGVPFFSEDGAYAENDIVRNGGQIFRALAATGPGAFAPADWQDVFQQALVSDVEPSTPANKSLWIDSSGAPDVATLKYYDAATYAFVPVTGFEAGSFVPSAGGTMTGPLVLPSASPDADYQAAHKLYVDTLAAARPTLAEADARYLALGAESATVTALLTVRNTLEMFQFYPEEVPYQGDILFSCDMPAIGYHRMGQINPKTTASGPGVYTHTMFMGVKEQWPSTTYHGIKIIGETGAIEQEKLYLDGAVYSGERDSALWATGKLAATGRNFGVFGIDQAFLVDENRSADRQYGSTWAFGTFTAYPSSTIPAFAAMLESNLPSGDGGWGLLVCSPTKGNYCGLRRHPTYTDSGSLFLTRTTTSHYWDIGVNNYIDARRLVVEFDGTYISYLDADTGNWVGFSDRRMKDDIEYGVVPGVSALRPARFKFRRGHRPVYGFIAQDVAEVDEVVVSDDGEEGGMLSLDYTQIIPMLVTSVQQLEQRIALLETV